MICNEKLFGRPVMARNPEAHKDEVMVLQGLAALNIGIGGMYPYAICEDANGILRVVSIDDMKFIDSDISAPTTMTIRRYSLVPIQEEDMTIDNLIGRDDIYDYTREHKVTINNVVVRSFENPDNDYREETWREAIDTEGNCYRAGMLYWKGAEK